MSTWQAVPFAWASVAILTILFIRGASESAPSQVHGDNEPPSATDDAGRDASARAGVVDLA